MENNLIGLIHASNKTVKLQAAALKYSLATSCMINDNNILPPLLTYLDNIGWFAFEVHWLNLTIDHDKSTQPLPVLVTSKNIQ